jgi:hypothetical protein
MNRFARFHGLLWVGVLCYGLVYLPTWLGLGYDDGGWGTVLYGLGYVLGSTYRWAYRILFYAAGQKAFTGIEVGVAVLGFSAFLLADVLLNRWLRRGGRGGDGASGVGRV